MMKYYKRIFLLVPLLIISVSVSAQQLSESARISIITLGPGTDELYSAFGHSAIRVFDPSQGYDAAFNYGTFDFNQPNFYLNFAKGYLVYKLAVQDTRGLLAYYKRNNRSIQEQLLNLTQEQKQNVFDYLVNNAKPENANYYYDYFYDNCATKIGDVFVESLGSDFKFNEDFVDNPGLTIRELTDLYSAELYPWGKLGIDICLGMPMDKQLTNIQYMYLPDYVYKAFEIAQIRNGNDWDLVVKEDKDIFVADHSTLQGPFLTPNKVFWGCLVLITVISVLALARGKSLRIFDGLLFFIIGFLGVFLLLLWLATDHNAASWNLNLLWAWPTHFIIAFLLFRRKRARWVNWYLLITVIFGIALVVFWAVLPQALNVAFIPITLLIAMRSGFAILE